MYQKQVLGLAEAQEAIQVMIEEAPKADQPERPMAFAVADEHGDLIALARVDGALDWNVRMAIKKARSAARLKRSTRAIENISKNYNRPLCDAVGPEEDLTDLPGGEIVIEPAGGSFIGAIGASGRHADVDEALVKKGVEAIQNYLRSSK